MIAVTIGCVTVSFLLMLVLYKVVVGLLYPFLAVALMKGAHTLLVNYVIKGPDPRHLAIQGGVIGGGLLSVALAYFGSGVISLKELVIAGLSLGILAFLSIAFEQFRVAKAYRAADIAFREAEEARKLARHGELSLAEETLQEALLTTELGYGSIHPQVATIVMYLADVACALQRLDAAAVLFKRAAEIHLRLGEPGKGSVLSLQSYAEHLYKMGEFEQGRLVARRALFECKRAGLRDLAAGRCWLVLSQIQESLGRSPDAYRSSLTATEILEANLGDSHSETLRAEGLVARLGIKLGRLAEGERIVTDVLAKKERIGESLDEDFLNLLVDLYAVQSKRAPEEAHATLQKAIELFRVHVGPTFERADELIALLPGHLTRDSAAKLEPFYTALFAGQDATARLALKGDETLVNQVDASGWTPLQWAVFVDRRDIIECLLTMGADPNFGQDTDYPALFIASRWMRKWAMQALHRKGADVEGLTIDGSRPIHAAVRSGDQLTVDVLVSRHVLLDKANKRGWTPLHEAAYAGEKRLVIELLMKGADVNFKAPTHLETPLHAAILAGSWVTAETLLLNMADIHAENFQGVSPLRLAEQLGLRDIVELLVLYGDNREPEPSSPAEAVGS